MIKLLASRFWEWWTLSNWKDAEDLGVKFATIFGVIVIANFFVLKPDLVSKPLTTGIAGEPDTELLVIVCNQGQVIAKRVNVTPNIELLQLSKPMSSKNLQ